MPIYEYICEDCQKKFDKLVKTMGAQSAVDCPSCGSKKTARTLSVFAVASEGGKTSSGGDMPMCGRCGGPGPCAMG